MMTRQHIRSRSTIRPSVRLSAAAALLTFGAAPAAAEELSHRRWPNSFVARIEILALMQTLNADLLASRSATQTLEAWCADHKMADEPKIFVRRVGGVEKVAGAETRLRLRVEPGEPLRYRRVQLVCGRHVLSEADNWYVPSRLPEETNRLLETTQTPFGKAVQGLQPFRRTIDARILWSPLPQGWESKSADPNAATAAPDGTVVIPHDIFMHRAIVYGADQKPLSEVAETYTSETLDFGVETPAER